MPGPLAKWEYKLVIVPLSEAELNALGADGWELVTHDLDWSADRTQAAAVLIFKRPGH